MGREGGAGKWVDERESKGVGLCCAALDCVVLCGPEGEGWGVYLQLLRRGEEEVERRWQQKGAKGDDGLRNEGDGCRRWEMCVGREGIRRCPRKIKIIMKVGE